MSGEKLNVGKIIVGKITGVFGVKGWVKVYSWTEPMEGITGYSPWFTKKTTDSDWQRIEIESGKRQGKTVVAKIAGIDDRDEAMLLTGQEIAIEESQIKPLPKNEYYWRDLIGLRVTNLQGTVLGVVEKLMETGANDVLVLKSQDGKQHLIPWTLGDAVIDVDLEKQNIEVDWDVTWLEQD